MTITNLTKLQDLFFKIEKDLIKKLESFNVLGSYKNILKEVVSLDYNIFEMLYDNDTENYQEYMIDESVEYFQSQVSDSYYQLQKHFK